MSKRWWTALVVLLASLLSGADRSHPPTPGAPHPLTLPPVEHLTLSNGLPVLLVSSHRIPTVEVRLVVRVGATADPPDRIGLAFLTATMLTEGAAGKDALALSDAIDFLGAEVQGNADWEFSEVRLHVPAARLKEALPLMADVALRPAFPQAELERLRKKELTRLLEAREEPRVLGTEALRRAVYGEKSRLGLPFQGNAASISTVSPSEIRAFHRRYYGSANAVLIVVGDVDRSVLGPLEKSFGAWPRGGAAPPPPLSAPQLQDRTLWLVDKPGAPQSVIRIGLVGPARLTPDYHPLQVMNTLLGGSFASRLNDNLREQHGYTYGAGSRFVLRRATGLFSLSTDVQTPSTAAALGECLKELDRIRTPAGPEEVERARNYLALGYAQEFETTQQVASKLLEQTVYGLPADAYSSFVPKVWGVGVADVERVAETYVDPARIAIVIVGDRSAVEAPLRAVNVPPIKLVTVDELLGPAPRID